MSDRLVNVDNLCTNPANHKRHLCELKKANKTDRIEKLQAHPRYICNNCAGKANEEGALCAPGPYHN